MAAPDYSKNGSKLIFATRAEMCLDFANTLAYRGSAAPSESLHSFGELLKWCGEASVIPPRLIEELRGWEERHPKRSTDTFDESIALREAIYRIFHSVAVRANPDQVDLDLLNRGLGDAPRRSRVQATEKGFGWHVEESKTSTASILAPVLWSAGDLLVGPELAKLRACSNEKCRWLFLDDSKNGTRRWCSMQACGNRAKAHRHYQRQKQA